MQKSQMFTVNAFMGLNESVDTSLTKPQEATRLVSAKIDTGALENTKAPTKLYNVALTGINSLMTYYKDGSQILLASSGTQVYKWTGSAWTSILSGMTNDSYDFVNYNINDTDIIIFSNSTDNVKSYDGTTVVNVKKDGAGSTPGGANVAPKGWMIDIHYERLWVANDKFLYCSKDFDPNDFTTPTDPNEVNMHGAAISMYSGDGTKVKAFKVVFDDIIIFKEKKIFKIYGTSPSQYTKIELFNASGAISDRSVVSTPKGAFFVNKDGVYMYDGANVQKISDPIKRTWETLDQNNINQTIATYWKGKYILAAITTGSSERDLIIEYDTNTNQWSTREGYTVKSFTELNNQLIFSSSDGYVYTYDTGTPEITTWEGNYSNLGVPNGIKEISEIKFQAIGTGQINVSVITEKREKTKTITLSSSEKIHTISINNMGRLVKFKIESLAGASFKIKNFSVIYELDLD